MKCQCCDGVGYKERAPGSAMATDCPHCRGTGDIQDGDWWMCEVMMPDGGSICQVLIWSSNDESWQISEDSFEDMEARPLYRVDRVG